MGKWLIAAELREKQNARGLKTSWLLGKDWLRESTFTRAIHHLHRSPNSVWARCQTWLGFKGLTQTKQTRKKLLEMPHCKFITLQREYNWQIRILLLAGQPLISQEQFSEEAKLYTEGCCAQSEGGELTGDLTSASDGSPLWRARNAPADWPGCVIGQHPFSRLCADHSSMCSCH